MRRPLPLARPVPAPPAPEDVVYGIGRIDSSGRIADRTVTTALGWRGGDRLTLTADAGVVTARRDPGGCGWCSASCRGPAVRTSWLCRSCRNRR